MNISNPIPSTVSSISFSFLSTEDIKRLSVKQIVNPVLLDDLNRPNIGGLYDPALGPYDTQELCGTCRLSYYQCPGHFGHIELPVPVFHPLFMTNMYNLLRSTCLFCHRFKIGRTHVIKYAAKLKLLEHGLLDSMYGVEEIRKDEETEVDDQEGDKLLIFQARVDAYVNAELKMASGSKRDDYKNALVYQARKDLILEFLKKSLVKKCTHEECGATGYTFRKEGHTKIIEYDLPAKVKALHKALELKPRPNVLEKVADVSTVSSKRTADSSESSERSYSDVEMADGQDHPSSDASEHADTQLPRAANGMMKTSRGRGERVIAAAECREHLRRLFRNERIMCSYLFGRHGAYAPLTKEKLSVVTADIFFLDLIPVVPTRFRPAAKMGEKLFEHPQNELLAKIISTSYRLRDLNYELAAISVKNANSDDAARRQAFGKVLDALIQVQIDVNSFMDSSKNPAIMKQGKFPPAGVKQVLEKKDGLFRKNMMGKRVNYAARSVISPDVNIEPNEIGIPPVFARKLTFPEPVTSENFREMVELVTNGPKDYPGATLVEYEDGHQQSLDKLSREQRIAIANQLLKPPDNHHEDGQGLFTRRVAVNKKVYRHLRDGDVLILNRQPTLHKPSMMCHRARVLVGEKTIRMHYANCKSYNADFDGDEMNIHFPQNQIARAEATFLANTDNQYLVPTSGKPLRGLIQDHVVAGVRMTSIDSFFSREDYFQLLYGALRPEDPSSHYSGRLLTLPPAIWKPKPLWTGKQIISTVLKNITPDNADGLTLQHRSTVPGSLWGKERESEGNVSFLYGDLMQGTLDKASFGDAEYGLVHSVYEVYGAETAGNLLGILSRLFTKYLQHNAFTCRIDDLALTPAGDEARSHLLQNGRDLGLKGAIENFPDLSTLAKEKVQDRLVEYLEAVLRDDKKMAGLDNIIKSKLNPLTKSINDACMPHGLQRQFPKNHMQTMTVSGAKGSSVNANQISCLLGQQELEGRRVPVMVSGKTLPSFRAFETRAIAGGYISSRFLTGLKPQEFYFHCMAGREGLIDTAVKTSRSGYLQRCLIKHLEGICVCYDNTVRGSDSAVYQFNYGGDSLDVTKQKHLFQFDFIAQNETSFINKYRPKDVAEHLNQDEAAQYMKKVIKKPSSRRHPGQSTERERLAPTLSIYNPSRYLGATSERFAEAVDAYIKKNPCGLLKSKETEEKVIKSRRKLIPTKRFRMLMHVKYLRSLVEPGEAVGLIASQGIGEPSTQMTLNTFHFAGHGAANVTLGIPRLREIVMTASKKPKTPSMTLPVRPGVSDAAISMFCKKAGRVLLSYVVHNITVNEEFVLNGDARSTIFTIEIDFYPEQEYEEEYAIKKQEILLTFAVKFPYFLKKEIQQDMKKSNATQSQINRIGEGKKQRKSMGAVDDEDDGDSEEAGDTRATPPGDVAESEMGDGDAEEEKRTRQKQQQSSYESDSENDDDAESDMSEGERIEAAYAEIPAPNDSIDDKDAETAEEIGSKFLSKFSHAKTFTARENGVRIQLEFGEGYPKFLLVGLLERVCKKAVVREIPSIQTCSKVSEQRRSKIIVDGKEENQLETIMSTDGSNFIGLLNFALENPIVDETKIYSNDIYSILKTYGVEMARNAILTELSSVFDAYKINVDMRHKELIADYMTFDGGFKPFNRKGISTNASPLLKASYETTAAFIADATLYGDYDDLTTPSGNVVLGRPSKVGTGVFDVRQSIS